MRGNEKERWLQLCEQAANEQDSTRLMALITEIDRLLEAKNVRLKAENSGERRENEAGQP